jgi:hypothetical protein
MGPCAYSDAAAFVAKIVLKLRKEGTMKKSLMLVALIALAFSTPAFAASKSYQVTGPVVAMTDDTITVQKGSEKWEIARGSANVPADVKVGSKILVQYEMTADSITSKGPSGKSPASGASK